MKIVHNVAFIAKLYELRVLKRYKVLCETLSSVCWLMCCFDDKRNAKNRTHVSFPFLFEAAAIATRTHTARTAHASTHKLRSKQEDEIPVEQKLTDCQAGPRSQSHRTKRSRTNSTHLSDSTTTIMSLAKSLRALRSVKSFGSEKTFSDDLNHSDCGNGTLASLIACERWDEVRELLSNPNTDETREAVLSCQYGGKGTDATKTVWNNALHFACRFYPPWDVIKAIDRIHPQYMMQVDNAGRTVLHLAAKNGVSPQVIRYLCAKNPSAAGAQDVLGRTPLHYVCKHYGARYNEAKCEHVPLADSMRDVVRTISRTGPRSVNLEDIDGCGALEYAIEYEAPFKVVRDIQKACEKDWKKRRSSGLKHESLQQDLRDQFQAQQSRLKLEIMRLTDSSMSLSATEDQDQPRPEVIKKDEPVFAATSGQMQVMLSDRRKRPSEPFGAKRAMCA